MTPLSGDDQARDAQLANLKRGDNPAPPGNQLAVKHGGYSTIPDAQRSAEFVEIYEALAATAPLRDANGALPVVDEVAMEMVARALKRWRDVVAWCDEHGRIDDATGQLKGAAEFELRCERALHRACDVLGLNAKARAAIGVNVATGIDLAAKWAEENAAKAEGGGDSE
ncbi:MAG TPA: hypothetical protein VGO13_10965 [Solirubrobacterales bacterium]|jgi:hypothetical protein|nr:hypothetical protein [Solirubrobacterales bacterium]